MKICQLVFLSTVMIFSSHVFAYKSDEFPVGRVDLLAPEVSRYELVGDYIVGFTTKSGRYLFSLNTESDVYQEIPTDEFWTLGQIDSTTIWLSSGTYNDFRFSLLDLRDLSFQSNRFFRNIRGSCDKSMGRVGYELWCNNFRYSTRKPFIVIDNVRQKARQVGFRHFGLSVSHNHVYRVEQIFDYFFVQNDPTLSKSDVYALDPENQSGMKIYTSRAGYARIEFSELGSEIIVLLNRSETKLFLFNRETLRRLGEIPLSDRFEFPDASLIVGNCLFNAKDDRLEILEFVKIGSQYKLENVGPYPLRFDLPNGFGNKMRVSKVARRLFSSSKGYPRESYGGLYELSSRQLSEGLEYCIEGEPPAL